MGFNDEFREIKNNDAYLAMRNEISEVLIKYNITEGNKLEKQNRQIKHYKRTFFVWVAPLFVHFEADFDCISDSGDIWRKYEHMPLLSENTLPVK